MKSITDERPASMAAWWAVATALFVTSLLLFAVA
jgi:hypothetical protein